MTDSGITQASLLEPQQLVLELVQPDSAASSMLPMLLEHSLTSAKVKRTLAAGARKGNAPVRQDKLRGGYYTPSPIAHALADWAIQDPGALCLEPSAGDGEFVAAALQRLAGHGKVVAIELDADEAAKASTLDRCRATVIAGDFFAWFEETRPHGGFDVVLGNPPFIRYQDFPDVHRAPAFRLMSEEGFRPTRLTNAWLPFVVAATMALRPGGRLALVLPAELLQVMYAAELRDYLARKYSELTVITFKRLVFDGIQEEVILLQGVRGDGPGRIRFVELDGLSELGSSPCVTIEPAGLDLNHGREKWTQYYLSADELALVRELEGHEGIGRLGDYAEVDVGIVTGRNDFFVLTRDDALRHGIMDTCLPLVGRSAQIPGLAIERTQWERLADEGGKCYLLQLGDVPRSALTEAQQRYVEMGESMGFHLGYKCRVRLPHWWNVPSVWVPDGFLLRQIYDGPRIVHNRAGTTCTDTLHRLRTKPSIDAGWMAAASMNSLTFAFAEIRGRSYGGGVLELEPTEAEGLPFPKPQALPPADEIDEIFKARGLEAALDVVDCSVRREAGLSASDMSLARAIWRKLSDRRSRRKRR